MELKPVKANILVRVIEREQKTRGGIYIPATAKDAKRNPIVEVIAMGPEAKEELPMIEVGDTLLTGKWHCERVSVDGTDYGIIQPDGVLGKVVS